jgi:hypothetical protein
MKQMNSEAIASALDRMRAATRELATGCLLLTTKDAVTLSSIPLSAETLLGYPRWVMPRIAKNPRAKRPTYLFDPRDVRDLPRVLAGWQAAMAEDREAEFARVRMDYLAGRDMPAKEAA